MIAPAYLNYLFDGVKRKFADGFPNGSVVYLKVKFTKNLNETGISHLKGNK